MYVYIYYTALAIKAKPQNDVITSKIQKIMFMNFCMYQAIQLTLYVKKICIL